MNIYQYYANIGVKNQVLLGIAVIFITAFLLTRLTKLLRLPDVSAYVVAGIIIGPSVLGLISPEVVEGSAFLKDFALACVAFGIGKHFTLKTIVNGGLKTIIITLTQCVITLGVVALSAVMLGASWTVALLLGSIAVSASPTSTMVTINQYHAKGEFVDRLLQIVALSDVICIFLFSIFLAITAGVESKAGVMDVLLPVAYNLLVIALGIACGFMTGGIIKRRSPNNRLMLGLAMLAALSAACGIFQVSPLLCCMFYGATYVNFTKDKELFTQMDKFMPPVMCVFFALSGAGMSVSSLSAAGAIAVAFFLARIVGKVGGCFIGSVIARASKPVKRWMGFTMLPQASVSIGLAALAATVLSPSLGELVSGVVISSAVLYELIGPALSKLALIKSGSIGSALPPLGIAVSKVEGDWDKPESTEEDWQKPTGIPRYDVGSSFEVHDPLVGHIPPYEKPIGAIKWKKSPPKQDE